MTDPERFCLGSGFCNGAEGSSMKLPLNGSRKLCVACRCVLGAKSIENEQLGMSKCLGRNR